MNRTQCTSCGAAIFFATTATNSKMPMDALPVEGGAFFISPSGQCVHVDSPGEFAASARAKKAPLYTSHFVTCPNRDKHRKAKK